MRLLMACLFLLFSFKAYALPMWTYDLTGKIMGSDHAADYLRDVSVGDDFWIRMFVQGQKGTQDVGFVGRIGGWLFSYNHAWGNFYYAPEFWYASSTSEGSSEPAGSNVEIRVSQLAVVLFGFDESDNASGREEDRLVKRNGWIDPSKFLRGGISLDFWALYETPDGVRGDETHIWGEVASFTQVPEPDSLALLVLGLLGLVYIPRLRRSRPSCKSLTC